MHYYLGLYFLFFLWLFAASGLLLNHSTWSSARFWPNRKITTWERSIQAPVGDARAEADEIVRQLGLEGEIEWKAAPPEPGHLDFRVERPGHSSEVTADLAAGRVKVVSTEVNAWGILRALHTFDGVGRAGATNQRDWVLTEVWALSMDAVAVGLIAMVLGGVYMWWGLRTKRKFGLVALALGILGCVWLVLGR